MSIEQQVQILNSLTQIMHRSARGPYEALSCEFDYEAYVGGWSVGSKYSFVREGLFVSELLDDPDDEASDWVHALHQLMRQHTGGDWKKLIVVVDSDGKASTKFAY
ncbi:hypothetical protein [Pseudomonas tolaasii]|uniref:hypothetical protein n=1 Tax=Pseudomonas tolaasii TaxID=29442 RepID=UPI0003684FB5|nr:hypothetical protein [Pseudomonas tolaasii]